MSLRNPFVIPKVARIHSIAPFTSTLRTGRTFSLFNTPARPHANRIYDPIRTPNDLHTLTLLSASSNRALITLWTASWCRTCANILPLLRSLVEEQQVGAREGGLGFAEVQIDAPTIGNLPITYRVNSVPMLLAFGRQEARFDTRVVKPDEMKDEEGMRAWLLEEARRGGR